MDVKLVSENKIDVKLVNGKWHVNDKTFSDMEQYEIMILDIFIKRRWVWN